MCCGGGADHRITAVVAFTIPACTSSGAAEGTGKTNELLIKKLYLNMDVFTYYLLEFGRSLNSTVGLQLS